MTNGIDISIVICTRNRHDLLKQCLRSIEKGGVRPFEVLVVDQSDNDLTEQLVRELMTISNTSLRYIRLPEPGLSKARNAGVREARGHVVAFTDDDCLVGAGWVDSLQREFARTDACCVCGQTIAADHQTRDKRTLISTLECDQRKVIRGRYNLAFLGRGNNMAFRREELLKLGGFNEWTGVGTPISAGEDTDMLYRLLEVGQQIVRTPDAIVFHSQPDSAEDILRKKRQYAESSAAILMSRLRHGDIYAGSMYVGKLAYECFWLMIGGLLGRKWNVASVGWHSLYGSIIGIKYLVNGQFCKEMYGLTMLARESFGLNSRASRKHDELPSNTTSLDTTGTASFDER